MPSNCRTFRPTIGRRTFLASAVGGLAAVPFVARAGDGPLAVTDLVGLDGAPTARAHALAGKVVDLRGYVAPQLRPNPARVLVTEASQSPCGLCGLTHDAGAGILVDPDRQPTRWPDLARIRGRVTISAARDPDTGRESGVVLTDALVEAV